MDFDSLFGKKFDLKIILVVIFAIILGAYLIDLMFGKYSFIRMIELNNNLKTLNKSVANLKKENARLQKEYFELKELESE